MPIGGAGVRCGGWCQDCDHHKGDATIDGASRIRAAEQYLRARPIPRRLA